MLHHLGNFVGKSLADLRGGARGPWPPEDARGDIYITLQLRKVVSFSGTSTPRLSTVAPPLDLARGPSELAPSKFIFWIRPEASCQLYVVR